MRLLFLSLAAALVPAILPAQTVPAAGWSLTLAAEGVRFGWMAEAAPELSPTRAELRPSGRGGLHLTLEHSFGHWRAQLDAGWAAGEAEAGNEVLAIRDKSLDMSRYRLAPAIERRVSSLGAGELAVGLAPTLDLWQTNGNSRPRLGVEGRLAVRVPLGWMTLENRVAFGVSGAPLNQEDAGEGFELRALRWLAFGVGLRVPL